MKRVKRENTVQRTFIIIGPRSYLSTYLRLQDGGKSSKPKLGSVKSCDFFTSASICEGLKKYWDWLQGGHGKSRLVYWDKLMFLEKKILWLEYNAKT